MGVEGYELEKPEENSYRIKRVLRDIKSSRTYAFVRYVFSIVLYGVDQVHAQTLSEAWDVVFQTFVRECRII